MNNSQNHCSFFSNRLLFYKVAEKTLDKLNKIKKTKELTVFADYKLQKGLITTIDEEKLNLKATYKVLSSKLTISQIDEEVTITIEEKIANN